MDGTARRLLLAAYLALIVAPPAQAWAAAPVALFSDLTDGPISGWEESTSQGAAVTVWGRSFGARSASSTITACGVELSSTSMTDVVEWAAEEHDTATAGSPVVPVGLQRITFFLNAGMTAGAGTLSVSTAEGTSRSLPFFCRPLGSSHIYFFATSGSDTNDGLYSTQRSGTNGTKRSTTWARQHLSAGDVAYFRAGTWTDDDVDDDSGLGGGIFTFVLSNHNNGTANNSITIASYPGETAQLGSAKGLGLSGTSYAFRFPGATGTELRYWTVAKFTMEARVTVWAEGTGPAAGSTHQRLVGNRWSTSFDVEDVPGNGDGVELQGAGLGKTNLSVLGNYCHDIGVDTRGQTSPRRVYCMYLGGYGQIDQVDIGWNEFAWNTAGRGFQTYGHLHTDRIDNLFFHDNYVHDVIRQGIVIGGGDDNLGPQTDYTFVGNAWIYDNILDRPGPDDVSLQVGGGGWGKGGTFFVYNNVLSQPGVYPAIAPSLGTFVFQNNIILSAANAYDYYTYFDGDDCAHCTGDHNLYFGAGSGRVPAWDSSTLDQADPQFITPGPATFGDFQLSDTSPARDAGTAAVSSIVTTDAAGVDRPQGPAYDVGAFEYVVACVSDCPTSCGDGVCNGVESCSTCPADCPTGCEPDTQGSAVTSGCGCRTAHDGAGRAAALFLGLVATAAMLRRRR